METHTNIIDKVRKLLALSTSSNANEAAAAAAKANDLIDKYRLSQFDLEAETKVEEPIEQDDSYLYETGRITIWRHLLLNTLTKFYGVAHYNDVDFSAGRKVSRMRMVGRKSDMEICRYIFAYLSLECERLSKSEAKGKGKVFVASYQEGFVEGVKEQLKISREEVKKTATTSSSALIKLDERFEEAKKGMYDLIPYLRSAKSTSSRQLNGDAFGQGKERGKSIHLGSAMNSGSGIKMLGS